MLKLLGIWKAAASPNALAPRDNPAAALLTESDLDLHDTDFDADDPDIPDFIREGKKARQYEKQISVESDRKERQTTQSRDQEEQDREHRLRAWQASEQYRHAMQELTDDIADARQAAGSAYNRALIEKQKADDALENARRQAIVLGDGSRVYFTRDGSRLYGEDDRQITDTAAVAEARRQHEARPDATSHEDFVERRRVRGEADKNVERLRDSLHQLDDLEGRIKSGKLSPEDLAQARKDKRDIIDSLPPEAHEEYDRLQAARKTRENAATYRAADGPPSTGAPDVNDHFHQATAAAAKAERTEPASTAQVAQEAPAYKSAPDF